jgi:tetratricopeptide (TPR) repeat protein
MQEFNEYELHSPESMFHEGMDLLESDHLEEALSSFDRVVSVQPYNADAFFQKGVTLIKLGRVGDAVKSFEAAISLSPTGRYSTATAVTPC